MTQAPGSQVPVAVTGCFGFLLQTPAVHVHVPSGGDDSSHAAGGVALFATHVTGKHGSSQPQSASFTQGNASGTSAVGALGRALGAEITGAEALGSLAAVALAVSYTGGSTGAGGELGLHPTNVSAASH